MYRNLQGDESHKGKIHGQMVQLFPLFIQGEKLLPPSGDLRVSTR